MGSHHELWFAKTIRGVPGVMDDNRMPSAIRTARKWRRKYPLTIRRKKPRTGGEMCGTDMVSRPLPYTVALCKWHFTLHSRITSVTRLRTHRSRCGTTRSQIVTTNRSGFRADLVCAQTHSEGNCDLSVFTFLRVNAGGTPGPGVLIERIGGDPSRHHHHGHAWSRMRRTSGKVETG
jgi:hypothetical protein